ncbi:MAG: membrane protein insertase YidC [Saprospiraceae bacterium]|nr:membrane protein insertase YidC [Saprospiraceae bacterium]
MERNQIIGFILIFATLFAWIIYTKPSEAELEKARKTRDSIALLENKAEITTPEFIVKDTLSTTLNSVSDTMVNQQLVAKYGAFANAAQGTEEEYILENDLVRIVFNSKGGNIKSVTLKKHFKTVKDSSGNETKIPVVMLDHPENKFEYSLPVPSSLNKVVSTQDLYFTGSRQGNTLSLKANVAEGAFFEQKFVLAEDDYSLDYSIVLTGLSGAMDPAVKNIKLNWLNNLSKYEIGEAFEQNYSTAYFKKSEKDPDYCNCVSDDKQDLTGSRIDWVSHTNQFFNTSILALKTPFDGAILETKMTDVKNSDILKVIQSEVLIPVKNPSADEFVMSMYIGPNEFKRLRSFEAGLEEIIPFGSSIFGTINRWVIRPFFDYLSQFISSKGIVILVLIFIIKMMLYPLMYKMLYSQAKMGALKPELVQLKEKHKDDMQKQQLETMKIYREYGVSPLGGCLPMILQMPIWYALFRFFPASITFRQEPFLWANDLSSYDVFFYLPFDIPFFGAHVSLFTLLWAVSTIIYTYYNMQNMDLSANPAMKYIQYIMPVMFLAFFNNYASGLTCYMFLSNMINILQTIVTKNYIFDEVKIRAQLLKQKDKPKKKGGFQAKLEEAMRQQQAIQEQKKKNK